MFDDPSRSGSADRTSFRINHRPSRTIPVWQADRELSGTGAAGGLERESATTGAYHQTGEFNVALLDGGSGPGHSSQPSGMAQQVFPLDDAPGPEDRQGCDGRRLAIRLYWMWRKGWDYEQVKKFGSHPAKLRTGDGVQ